MAKYITDAPVRSTVDSTAGGVQLLDVNTWRNGGRIFNEGTKAAYIKFGETPSATSYSVVVYPSGYVDIPDWHKGKVSAICGSGDTTVLMTTQATYQYYV